MSEYKQQVINFFDKRIAYDSEEDSHPYEANKLLEFADAIQDGQTILDLATGTGLVAIAAAEQTASTGSVIGVDMSSGMLSQARSKMSALGIENLELIEADIQVKVCQDLFGIDFPHILRSLWTPEKCQELLKQSGFQNIEIECDRRGKYLVLDEYPVSISCKEGYMMPKANPLVNLTAGQKEELQSAYQQAINDLVTEEGLWSDRSLLFVKAQK